MAWGPVPAGLLAAGAACYYGMKAAWRHKATFRHATFTFKACYTGMCLLGGSGAVLLVLPDEANTRFATPRPRSLPRALAPPPPPPPPPQSSARTAS